MKIRNGFVSNSSSSSFLIYGACIDGNFSDEMKKIITEKFPEENYTNEDFDGMYDSDIREILEGIIPDFEFHTINYDDGSVYVGISPECQDDDVTHGDWKKNIQDELTKALPGMNVSFGWYEDCSFDG